MIGTNGDGVSDQYVRGITRQMQRAGFTTWDADADFDGDGQSNRAEIDYLNVPATESGGTKQVFVRKDPDASTAFYTVDVQ